MDWKHVDDNRKTRTPCTIWLRRRTHHTWRNGGAQSSVYYEDCPRISWLKMALVPLTAWSQQAPLREDQGKEKSNPGRMLQLRDDMGMWEPTQGKTMLQALPALHRFWLWHSYATHEPRVRSRPNVYMRTNVATHNSLNWEATFIEHEGLKVLV